jgi:microcompartment protein CcmL/EutN
MQPAIALLELDSIAIGIEAGDAMAKRSPIDVIYAGTVHPGRYLVLVGGAVADVEEALEAGRAVGGPAILDLVLLADVHPDVIETQTVAAIIDAADAGVKGARVRLLELRLADGLGGKAYLLFGGSVADVEAAVEIGQARIGAPGRAIARVIPQLHGEMRENLEADARFRHRLAGRGEA